LLFDVRQPLLGLNGEIGNQFGVRNIQGHVDTRKENRIG